MNTLLLAWRNLLRNRRRSLMTLVAMVLGVMAVLLFGGYITHIKYALQSDVVMRMGHLQLQHEHYFSIGGGNPAAYGIAGYDTILDALRRDPVLAPMLAVATPTLQFGAIAGNSAASVTRTVYVHGMVVEDQNRLREWNDYGLEEFKLRSRATLSGTPADTAVIGTGVARVLQLCDALQVPGCVSTGERSDSAGVALPDDIAALANQGRTPATAVPATGPPRIDILAANARGAPNVATIGVLRAEFQGVKELDDVYVGMHLSQAQKLVFGAAPAKVTAIVLQLRHTDQIPAARERLDELLKTTFKGEPLGLVDYETLDPIYRQTLAMFAAIFSFISVLMGAIVLFTVTNTMSMAVAERTAEIGTLRAIGLRRSGIRAMFVSEGIMLGCAGAALGIGASLVMAWVINELGFSWIPPGRIDRVPVAVVLAGENAMLVGSAVVLVIVAALSALLPAMRASRMNIVDALRHA